MGPIVTAGAVAIGSAVPFLARVANPALDELGLWLRDEVRAFRMRNVTELDSIATQIAYEGGVEPQQVSLKILIPALDAASLEDNQDMIARWAALLVSAANPDNAASVLPIFSWILQQLISRDVYILDYLHKHNASPARGQWGVPAGVVQHSLKIADNVDFDVSCDSLLTLGLVQREPAARIRDNRPIISNDNGIALTALGRRFIHACQPPAVQQRGVRSKSVVPPSEEIDLGTYGGAGYGKAHE